MTINASRDWRPQFEKETRSCIALECCSFKFCRKNSVVRFGMSLNKFLRT